MTDFKDKAHFKNVKALRATDKALFCEINEEDHWIPRSQIDDSSEVYEEGHEGELVVSQWIADEKGLG